MRPKPDLGGRARDAPGWHAAGLSRHRRPEPQTLGTALCVGPWEAVARGGAALGTALHRARCECSSCRRIDPSATARQAAARRRPRPGRRRRHQLLPCAGGVRRPVRQAAQRVYLHHLNRTRLCKAEHRHRQSGRAPRRSSVAVVRDRSGRTNSTHASHVRSCRCRAQTAPPRKKVVPRCPRVAEPGRGATPAERSPARVWRLRLRRRRHQVLKVRQCSREPRLQHRQQQGAAAVH